ncbi:hypothetical protein, partial [Salmonella sp. SAL4449]|uniref:hypothetical protein n=1 Tax=Salmonella sp. SAL4449 TaxID=3159904 RepID=UPI00397DA272
MPAYRRWRRKSWAGWRSNASRSRCKRCATISSNRNRRAPVRSSGQASHTLYGHTDRIRACAFSLDGQRVVSAGMDRM